MCPVSSLTVLLQGGCGSISRSQGWTSLQLRDFGVPLRDTDDRCIGLGTSLGSALGDVATLK